MTIRTTGIVGPCLLIAVLCGFVYPSHAQIRDPQREIQERAEALYFQQRIDRFIENAYEFYEISGELISFRVHPNMTQAELDRMDDKAEELEDKAGDLISFIRFLSPIVRGNTGGLWVVLKPLEADAPLEDRLTLLLSMVNGVEPKLQHFIELLTEEVEPSVDVGELMTEATLPFLIAGGLEEIQGMTRDLRAAL